MVKKYKVYWTVHISNFDSFIDYILCRYNTIKTLDLHRFKNYYRNSDYLYLCISDEDYTDGSYALYYEKYEDSQKEWLDTDKWKDMGEFLNRRNKLEKINNLSNE